MTTNNQSNEARYLKTAYALSKQAKSEKNLNIVFIALIVGMILAQYNYFMSYTKIDPNSLLEFIEVPTFNPLLGIAAYLGCTLFAFFAYPRKKIAVVRNAISEFRQKYSGKSSEEELSQYESEVSEVLKQRKQALSIQVVVTLVICGITAGLLCLSYNLRHHTTLNNEIGQQITALPNGAERLKALDAGIKSGQLDRTFHGYYVNQIFYMESERLLNANIHSIDSAYISNDESQQISLAQSILSGSEPNIPINAKAYLDNMHTWADLDSNGKFVKSKNKAITNKFLHNQDPLIVLGNYLKAKNPNIN